MANEEKTVFISYRRKTSSMTARAIYQDLRHNGYDMFMDVQSIDSGTFDTIILNQIAARAHFIVILEPGSEKRLAKRGDWLRREVERAIELKRNIVPILASNFSFKAATRYLTGKLEELPLYSGVPLHTDYFEEAMERLRSRFLKQPVSVAVVPTPAIEREIVAKKTGEASQLPAPKPNQFTAEFLLNRGNEKYSKGDFTDAIQDFSEAMALDPKVAPAYYNRGLAYHNLGQHDKAMKDYDQAIALNLFKRNSPRNFS